MAQETIIIKVETGKAQQSVAKLDKGLEKTGKSAKKTGKGLTGAFGAMKAGILSAIPALNAFKVALISTGVGAIVVAVGALVGVMAKAARAGADFGKGVSTLRAVTGKTADELERVTNQAKELGSTTAFTAKQVLGLQTELAKLGFSLQDIENSTPAILDLAASLEIGLSEAAAFAGSTVRAFGLETEDTQRLVDVFAKSTSTTALDFDKLRESLKMVAPAASAVGVSVERTTALLGGLANTGISGSMAGTGLAKTFIELSKKGLTLEEAMDQVNGSSNKLNTAIELVGINGGKALLNLAKVGNEELDDLTAKFEGAEGAAGKMAEVRLDNLEGDMTKLGSAWEGLLLGFEDGEGPINFLQRKVIQGLTLAIEGLGFVIDVFAFSFRESWNNIKLAVGGATDILKGYLKILGGSISMFANGAMLAISKIPLIGKAIDKAAAQKRFNEAKKLVADGAKDIQDGAEKYAQIVSNRMTAAARFAAEREGKAERQEKAKQEKKNQEQQAQFDAEAEENRKKAAEEARKQRESDLKKLAAIEKKYLQASQNLEDKTEVQKSERKRQRALEELNALKLSTEEKRKAEKQINDYYDDLQKEAQAKDDEKAKAERDKKNQEKLDQFTFDKEVDELEFNERRARIQEQQALLLEDELLNDEQKALLTKQLADRMVEINTEEQEHLAGIEAKKRQEKFDTLDAVISVAGAESGVGKALLVAKQALMLKESILELKRITFKGKQAIAESAVDSAKNVSSSSKIGFPQNIITIAMAIGQGIALMRSVKKAVAKTGAAGAGGGGETPTVSSPRMANAEGGSQLPAFNIVGSSGTNQLADAIAGQQNRPIKAFVTSQDVTTAQSLERNIVDGATIG